MIVFSYLCFPEGSFVRYHLVFGRAGCWYEDEAAGAICFHRYGKKTRTIGRDTESLDWVGAANGSKESKVSLRSAVIASWHRTVCKGGSKEFKGSHISEPKMNNRNEALSLDSQNPSLRHHFCFPKHTNGRDKVYLTGNSLGLMPTNTKQMIREELEVWASQGVDGHFDHPHGRPWVSVDEAVLEPSARIVGFAPS